MRIWIFSFCLGVVAAVSAGADSIVVDGKSYTDVLIYESGEFYYVKIPPEGKSLSVSKSKVAESQVTINDDPYYREQLRDLYKAVKEGGDAALKAAKPVDSAFTDIASGPKEIDTSALFAAGGGKPMKLSVAEAKAAAQAGGVTLAQSGESWKGKSSDGILSITISVSDGKVTGLTGAINATEQAQVLGKLVPLFGVIGKVAPWAQGWAMGNAAKLGTPGSNIQQTQAGVSVAIGVSASGLNFNVKGA